MGTYSPQGEHRRPPGRDLEIHDEYQDVLFAVSGGKLVVVTHEELQRSLGRPLMPEESVSSAEDLAVARSALRHAFGERFDTPQDAEGMVVAADEALANALKHAGAGSCEVYAKGRVLQVEICDHGPGIDFTKLPNSTVMAGLSTTQTLGMGFHIMLQVCERVLLATRPGDTKVLLETSVHDRAFAGAAR